jgi:hypothetical protein
MKRLVAVLLLLGAAPPVLAVGEQVGRIRGVVRDAETRQPLIAVTVTARGAPLIGGPAVTQSNDSGRFELLGLPQGDYTLEFGYPDTVPLVRAVTVRPGEAVTVNADWSPQASAVQTVAVVQERQRTKPDSTQTGTVLNAATLNNIPTGRSYQSASLLVPGTSGGANPNVKGAGARNNRYLIDGLDVTDPASNTFSLNLTFDSLQSVDVITGGMDAQYNAIGGVINVVTRGGADSLHGIASVYANRHELSATGNYGPNLYEGLQALNDNPSGPNESYRLSFTIGGPFIRQRLWYSATYEFVLNTSSTVPSSPLGVSPYNIQHPSRRFIGHYGRVKLSYAPTADHRFSLTSNADPSTIDNSGGGNKNAYLGVAEQRQNQGGIFTVLAWEWLRSQRVLPSLQVGVLYNFIENGPQGRLGPVDFTGCTKFSPANCVYDPNRPLHNNVTDNTSWYQGGDYLVDHRLRVEVDPTVVVRANARGLHTFKAGIQGQYQRYSVSNETPGGVVYNDQTAAGDPLEAGLCNLMTGIGCFRRTESDAYSYADAGFSLGLFAQDSWWTPLQWLTVVPGLRADYGMTYDRNGVQRTSLFGLGPRLGLVADLTQDGKNVVFAYYGRKTEPLNLAQVSNIDSTEIATSVTREWESSTRDFTRLISRTGGEGSITVASGTTMPHADEITAGARRELMPNTVASIEYTFKRIVNQWTLLEINRVWDPSGSRVVDYQDRSKAGQQLFEYRTPDDPRLYHGLIIATEGRPTPAWDYGASYTLSWSYATFSASNPRQYRFFDGYQAQDQRHFLRAYGSYAGFPRVVLGGVFVYQSGGPLTKGFYNAQTGGYGNQRSPLGTLPGTPNDPTAIAEFRVPDQIQLDLHASYNVLPGRLQHRLELVLDVFNAFNLRTPNAVTATDIARFGQVTSRQGPLRVQLAMAYSY